MDDRRHNYEYLIPCYISAFIMLGLAFITPPQVGIWFLVSAVVIFLVSSFIGIRSGRS